MGLLDEAIRDHLELKRRRGADPTEVAREEHEALEPVFPEEPRPAGLSSEEEMGEFADEIHPPASPEEVTHGEPGLPIAQEGDLLEPHPGDFSTLGQETAEIDMQSVLDADGPLPEREPEQIPGQERLTFE